MKFLIFIFLISNSLFSGTFCKLIDLKKNEEVLSVNAENAKLKLVRDDRFKMYVNIEDREILKISIKEYKKKRSILKKEINIKNLEILKLKTKLRGFEVNCQN